MGHSRSSSELYEMYDSNDILPAFYNDFRKDFEFSDLDENLKDLFTNEEYTAISSETDPDKQTTILLKILSAKSKEVVDRFLNEIKKDYSWIVRKVREQNDTKNIHQYLNFIKKIRSDDQKHTDYNVYRIEPYYELKKALLKLKRNHFVIVTGELGCGKKWLAKDVCCDYKVLEAMDFKIFSLDLENCNNVKEDLKKLIQLANLMDNNGTTSASHLKSFQNFTYPEQNNLDKVKMKKTLERMFDTAEFQKSLLVLENVNNKKALNTFNLGCKILVITRNKNVAESISRSLSVRLQIKKDLTDFEFSQLFEKILKTKKAFVQDLSLHKAKCQIIVFSAIAQKIKNYETTPEKCLANLQNSNVADYSLGIENSLAPLDAESFNKFKTLAIFPDSVKIPIKLLAYIWDQKVHQINPIIEVFKKHYLINYNIDPDTGERFCSLLLIYSSYLNNNVDFHEEAKQQLHKKVVDFYYKEEKAFEDSFSKGDTYFFLGIEHHLKNASSPEPYILGLSELFFDFEFLQQKLKTLGLVNVLSSLKFYEDDIINEDPFRRSLLHKIRDFLLRIEEKLVHSQDTSLIQYALLENDEVYEEAVKQARKLGNRVWFKEKGNFHQRRQIAQLGGVPKIIRTLKDDCYLIVLDNKDIVLKDLSIDSFHHDLHFDNSSDVIDLCLFNDNKFFLTLDKIGLFLLWSIKTEQPAQRRSSKSLMNSFETSWSWRQNKRKYKQAIHDITQIKKGTIIAYYIEYKRNEISLHVAFRNGDVHTLLWDPDSEEFKYASLYVLNTNMPNICVIRKIFTDYFFIMNQDLITIWTVIDFSQVPLSNWKKAKSKFVGFEFLSNRKSFHLCEEVIFVFEKEVQKLLLWKGNADEFVEEISYLYREKDPRNCITCARVCPNEKYLLLGTKSGLIVIDIESQQEVLRSNVADVITSVDIHELNDPKFKYFIGCGVENKRMLYLFSILEIEENIIAWSHSVKNINNIDSYKEKLKDHQLEPGVWLKGKQLFTIVQENSSPHLLAVDSKRRIHKVAINGSKNQWTVVQPECQDHEITAITAFNDEAFIAYENGLLVNWKTTLTFNFENAEINFLKLIDQQILVASSSPNSSSSSPSTFIINIKEESPPWSGPFKTINCFKLFEDYSILITPNKILLFEILNGNIKLLHSDMTILASDLQNSYLFIANRDSDQIMIYKFDKSSSDLKWSFDYKKIDDLEQNIQVTCLKATNNGNLIALGYNDGTIKIFQMTTTSELKRLAIFQSHRFRINDLKFSPNNAVLVSCAEQLCFWSITYILNKTERDEPKKSKSSRFISQQRKLKDTEEVDAKVFDTNFNHFLQNSNSSNKDLMPTLDQLHNNKEMNNLKRCFQAWDNKIGHVNKPELLACYKFDGNEAMLIIPNEDFTQFHTIDDEGVYYNLELNNHILPYNSSNHFPQYKPNIEQTTSTRFRNLSLQRPDLNMNRDEADLGPRHLHHNHIQYNTHQPHPHALHHNLHLLDSDFTEDSKSFDVCDSHLFRIQNETS